MVLVYMDHKNLENLTTSKLLNRRQARRVQELPPYDFKILYGPSVSNGQPTALSWRSEYRPERGVVGSDNQPILRVICPDQLVTDVSSNLNSFSFQDDLKVLSLAKLRAVPLVQFIPDFLERVVTAASNHTDCQDDYYRATSGEPSAEMIYINGILYYKGRLWIPDNNSLWKEVCKEEHDLKIAGHITQDKTVDLI